MHAPRSRVAATILAAAAWLTVATLTISPP